MDRVNKRLVCPKCKQALKITKKCSCCGEYCCSECSVNGLCNQCFIMIYDMDVAYKENVFYHPEMEVFV